MTPRLTRAREAARDRPAVQDTITQALVRPSVPRVFTHNGCGGWVLWDLEGGFCLDCGAGPLRPGEYRKPGAAA
jgi:hypothetical protein